MPFKLISNNKKRSELLGEGFYGRVLKVRIEDKDYCLKESRGGFNKNRQVSLFDQVLFCSRLEHENVLGVLHVTVDINDMPMVRNSELNDYQYTIYSLN